MSQLLGPALLGSSVFLIAALARSDVPGQLNIEWRAPEGCPSADDVRRDVERFLGGPARLASGESLEARASVTRDEVWRVSLTTISGANTRKRAIEADSCRGLAEATALILALMIDPNAVAVHGEQAPTSTSPADSASAPPEPKPPVTPAAPAETIVPAAQRPPTLVAPSKPVGFGVGPLISMDVGLLPLPEVAIGGYATVFSGPIKLALAGRYGLGEPATGAAASGSDPNAIPGGKFRLVSATLTLCDALARGRFDVGICGSFDVGRLRGEGINVSRVEVQGGLWVAAAGGGFASWNVTPRVAIPLELALVVPLSRYRFVLDNVGEVFSPAAVGGRATLGVELHF